MHITGDLGNGTNRLLNVIKKAVEENKIEEEVG